MKKTKIVCTLGPSTDSPEVVEQLLVAGMNVARFNFSHGDHPDHRRRLEMLREVSGRMGIVVGALGDLQGPKIRVGRFADGFVHLDRGQTFTITTRDVPGDREIVSTTHPELPRDVHVGDSILLADGLLELRVLQVTGTDVTGEVLVGGPLSNNKGINLPHSHVTAPSLTGKDREDLEFALSLGFDFIALSFVRTADDIRLVRKLILDRGHDTPIVAKIEKPQAVVHFDEILQETDVVMIARGDLGVEMPPESVPATQKEIIHKCNLMGVPVITATQMLESMIDNPRPTRAEASDVANAIFDGTDAVMLSGETANGKYPDLAVQMMTRIAKVAEIQDLHDLNLPRPPPTATSAEEAVSIATCRTADSLGAECIVTYTLSGATAKLVAKHRPRTRILALTPRVECARRLALVWGVEARVVVQMDSVEELFRAANRLSLEDGIAAVGDTIVITAGAPLGRPRTTNMMKVHQIEAIPDHEYHRRAPGASTKTIEEESA